MVSPSKDGMPFNTIMKSEYLAALKDSFGNFDSQSWKGILADSPQSEYAKCIAYLIQTSATISESQNLPHSFGGLLPLLHTPSNV